MEVHTADGRVIGTLGMDADLARRLKPGYTYTCRRMVGMEELAHVPFARQAAEAFGYSDEETTRRTSVTFNVGERNGQVCLITHDEQAARTAAGFHPRKEA